jgi:hypothetical protein
MRLASMLVRGGLAELKKIGRKLAAVTAVLALLLSGLSAIAETLSAADLPACCNTAYCPVHHRQGRDLQKDKSDCAGMGAPGQNSCSMRGCDAAPKPLVGTSSFLLVEPYAIHGLALAESALATGSRFLPYAPSIPLTPPPRTLPS